MSTLHTGAAAPTLPADLKSAFEPRPARISTLERLINRGDQVAIVDGILHIQPISAKPVPNDWYNANLHRLVAEIAEAMNVAVYIYVKYSTGQYKGDQKRVHSGVTLQFMNVITNENSYAIFNVGLKRVQASSCGTYKKGDPLKKNRFTPPEKGAFCQFWERSKLPNPRHLSEYSEKMGQLKKFIFTMAMSDKEKAKNETIKSLSVTYAEIVQALNMQKIVRAEFGQGSGKVRVEFGQASGESFGQQTQQSQIIQGLQAILTTWRNRYGLS